MAAQSSNNAHIGCPCGLACLQGNMRQSKPSLLTLLIDAANKKTHHQGVQIFFITEPPTIRVTNKLSNVPGDTYNVFAERGGHAALITTGIISWRCPQYCASDIIVCQTKIHDQLTYLVSMYMDGKTLEFPSEFIQLIANKGECDILVASDSNAHSTVWNCPRTDRRGELVKDFLISNNLQCVNVGNRPTFCSGAGNTSIIDITFANLVLQLASTTGKLTMIFIFLDHYRILFSIQ